MWLTGSDKLNVVILPNHPLFYFRPPLRFWWFDCLPWPPVSSFLSALTLLMLRMWHIGTPNMPFTQTWNRYVEAPFSDIWLENMCLAVLWYQLFSQIVYICQCPWFVEFSTSLRFVCDCLAANEPCLMICIRSSLLYLLGMHLILCICWAVCFSPSIVSAAKKTCECNLHSQVFDLKWKLKCGIIKFWPLRVFKSSCTYYIL